jgi:hypothetical protein
MAKDMSFKSYEQEIKSNPYMQMFMQKQNYNLDVIRFNDDSKFRGLNYDLAVRREDFNQLSSNRDYAYKVKKDELDNPPPIITTTTLPTVTTPKTVASQFAVAGEKADLMKGLKNKYASRLFPGLTVDQQQEAFSNLYKRYDTNPNGNYSPDEVEFLNSYRRANTDMLMASNLATAAEKIKTEEEDKVYKNITGAGGYSKEDVINVVKELGKFTPKEYDEKYNYFKTYQGGKYFSLYKAYNGDASIPKQREIKNAIDNAKTSLSSGSQKVNEAVENFLAKNTPKKLAQDMALDMNDPKTKAAVNKYLTSAALTASEIGAGDVKNVLKLIAGEDGGKTKAVVRHLAPKNSAPLSRSTCEYPKPPNSTGTDQPRTPAARRAAHDMAGHSSVLSATSAPA